MQSEISRSPTRPDSPARRPDRGRGVLQPHLGSHLVYAHRSAHTLPARPPQIRHPIGILVPNLVGGPMLDKSDFAR